MVASSSARTLPKKLTTSWLAWPAIWMLPKKTTTSWSMGPSACTLQKKHIASCTDDPAGTTILLPNWTSSRLAWAGTAANTRAADNRRFVRKRWLILASLQSVRESPEESSVREYRSGLKIRLRQQCTLAADVRFFKKT